MKEKQITVTQDELERIVYEEIQKERKILFDLCLEDYFLLPIITEQKRKGKVYIYMSKSAWTDFLEQISKSLGDLEIAREIIGIMEPVYTEYHKTYEENHSLNFDDYMRASIAAYDADEFEHVRDMFEEEYYKRLNDEEER